MPPATFETVLTNAVAQISELNPALKPLLDHLAEELAHEYVRLMEAATNPMQNSHAGDH